MVSTAINHPVVFTVSVPGIGFYAENIVTQSDHMEIQLPYQARLEESDDVQHKTVIVEATDEVSVHVIRTMDYIRPDGFTALPTRALGKQYLVMTSKGLGSTSSHFSMSALNEETYVHFSKRSCSDVPWQRIKLQPYESFQVHDPHNDLSGTFIVADKPIAVVAGTTTGPLEQMPSTDSYGRHYVIAPFSNTTTYPGYKYRIISPDRAHITIDNKFTFELDAQQIYEGVAYEDSSMTFISSDKPILVMEYYRNDGYKGDLDYISMVLVPSLDMFTGNITVPVYYITCYPFYFRYFINIVSQCSNGPNLMYDDTHVLTWQTISLNGMCLYSSEVTDFATHRVTHTDPKATFSVTLVSTYTYINTEIAYAYLAGFVVRTTPHLIHRWM